jgi:hypothetical protein
VLQSHIVLAVMS